MDAMRILDRWPAGTPLHKYFEQLPIDHLRCGWVPCMSYLVTSSRHGIEELAPYEITKALFVVSERLCGVKWTSEVEIKMPPQPQARPMPRPAPPIDPTALNPVPSRGGAVLKEGSPPPPKRSADQIATQILAMCAARRQGKNGYVEVDPRAIKLSSLKTKVNGLRAAEGGHEDLSVYEAANGNLIVIIDPNRQKRGRRAGVEQ